jgi:hypothetical protein
MLFRAGDASPRAQHRARISGAHAMVGRQRRCQQIHHPLAQILEGGIGAHAERKNCDEIRIERWIVRAQATVGERAAQRDEDHDEYGCRDRAAA